MLARAPARIPLRRFTATQVKAISACTANGSDFLASRAPTQVLPSVSIRSYSSSPVAYGLNGGLTRVIRGSNYDVIPDIMVNGVKNYADKQCLGTRVGDGYEWITYSEFG